MAPSEDHPADWRRTLLVWGALESGLLAGFADPSTPEQAARAAGLDPRASAIAARALVDAGCLEDAGGGALRLAGWGETLVGAPGGEDLAGALALEARAMRSHLALAQTLRTGRPQDDVSGGDRATRERFMRAMREVAAPRAPATVEALGAPAPGARLLDIGGAPGTYARAFAAAGWDVTVLDLPGTLEIGAPALHAAGVATVAGDATHGAPGRALGRGLHRQRPPPAGARAGGGAGGPGRAGADALGAPGDPGGARRPEPPGARIRGDDAAVRPRAATPTRGPPTRSGWRPPGARWSGSCPWRRAGTTCSWAGRRGEGDDGRRGAHRPGRRPFASAPARGWTSPRPISARCSTTRATPTTFDRAVLAYRRHLGVPLLGPAGHLFVVRSLELDYRSSAGFDEELEVFVRVSELGRTSHVVQARLERTGGDGPAHVADARLVVVGLAAYGGRPSRMPADMREAIAAFEGLS